MSPRFRNAVITGCALVLVSGCKSEPPLQESNPAPSSQSSASPSNGTSPQAANIQASPIQQSAAGRVGIEVKDVEVQLVTPPRGYLVFGKLGCTGNRSLKNIELTTYFLDESGRRLGEQKDHPLAASETIKPGNIKDIKISIKPPDGWKSKVEVIVTNYEIAN